MRPVVERLSPNHNSRGRHDIEVVVLHADAAPTERSCLSWVQSAESKVSYHYLVGRDGTIYRLVPDGRRAWHAGKAVWQGEKDVNGISVGCAFSNRNDGKEPLTAAQVTAMQELVASLQDKYGPLDVTTHAQVSPGRKDDPERVPGFQLTDYL